MKSKVKKILDTLSQRYADKRLWVFDIVIDNADPDLISLNGKVLETHQLQILIEKLASGFPAARVDTSAIRVLRYPGNPVLAVGTNLAGVYLEKSFHSELASQVFFGESLEILEEQDRWAFTRQEDGYLGCTYLPYLTGKIIPPATHWVVAPMVFLHAAPSEKSPILTRLHCGTAVHLQASSRGWANIAAGFCGWVNGSDLRPLEALPLDTGGLREQMVRDALRLIGTPYLWGGVSASGIDCSGFTRLVHRLSRIAIPRDADLQHLAGRPVEPPFRPGDLVFFGEGSRKKRISHVGMSLGGWELIHSSLARNGVYTENIQASLSLRENLAGACCFLSD